MRRPFYPTRPTRPARHCPEAGFSVLELIIVVTITMVLVAVTAKSMTSAVRNYRMNTAARQLAAMSQLAKIKATSRNTWYRLTVSATNRNYRLETYNRTTNAWDPDAGNDWVMLPDGVNFVPPPLGPVPPPGHSGPPASEMSFNTRGLLVNVTGPTTAVPTNSRCIYLVSPGTGVRVTAVCASLAGKSTMYRMATGAAGVWEVQ